MKPKMEQPTTNQNWVSASKTCRARLYLWLGKMDVAICEWNLLIIIIGISQGKLHAHVPKVTFFTYMLNQPHHSTSQRTSNWLRPWRNKVWKILNDCFPFTTTSLKGHDVSGLVRSQPRHNETNESCAPNRKPLNHVLAATNKSSFCRKRLQNYVQHANFVCPLLHHALSQFGPKEILGNSAKVSRPGRLIWAVLSDEWLPLLDCTSQTVQDCPHTDGHPSSHNHGKWIKTTSC